jgi:hypothetical protein
MRMRTIVAAAALGALLAGCTPVSRAVDGPLVLPPEIAWRYASFCIETAGTGVSVTALHWSNAGADVDLEAVGDQTTDLDALELEIEGCLTEYRYEEREIANASIYERAELYEYYTGVTIPCLARQGIDVDPVPREVFIDPDGGEPWNPYFSMDIPFEQLLGLYETCPPRPDSLDTGAAG